jgi:hypothetical protein
MAHHPDVPDSATGLITVLPPSASGASGATKNSGANPIVVNGRTYTAALGASLQVPAMDGSVMIENGWTAFGRFSGTTAQRPVAPNVSRGVLYYDTTVGHIIVWDGATWRDHDGSSV